MKLNLDLNDEKLKESIKDNQELVIVFAVFAAAVALFLIFILPSILNFPSKISERNFEVEEFNKIKKAKEILETTDKNQLESDVELVTRTLPSDRNYELILGAISDAAIRSNSIITGYTYETSQNVKKVVQGQYPGLIFEIIMDGEIDQAANFVDQLKIAYPISEVQEISYERGEATIIVSFYYKPFTDVKAEDVALARNKSDEEKKALEEISNWNLFTLDAGFIQMISSVSASPF